MVRHALRKAICSKDVGRITQLLDQYTPSSADVFEAVRQGDGRTLELIRERSKCVTHPDAFKAAVQHGHVHLLDVLCRLGFVWEKGLYRYAVQLKQGRSDMIQRLHKLGCPFFDGRGAAYAAAEQGDLETIRLLHEIGCPWSGGMYGAALQSKDASHAIATMQVLHELGCPWDNHCYYSAIRSGDVDLIAELHRLGCPWVRTADGGLYSYAVNTSPQHMRCTIILQLHRLGCPFEHDVRACHEALLKRDLVTVRCLRNLGFGWMDCEFDAIDRKLSIADTNWLRSQGCPDGIQLPRAEVFNCDQATRVMSQCNMSRQAMGLLFVR